VAGVQLGVAAGCSVVATVRNPKLRKAVAAFGCQAVDPEGFGDHGPFHVILELIGASNLAPDLAALVTGGRITVIGVGGGARGEIDLLGLMTVRGRIHGSTLRARSLEEKAVAARAVERHVLPLLESGAVRVPVEETYPMHEAAAAYARFAEGGKLGKIVLTA
jgi:NADPH:quinone reductase